jgi:hypothetical protein
MTARLAKRRSCPLRPLRFISCSRPSRTCQLRIAEGELHYAEDAKTQNKEELPVRQTASARVRRRSRSTDRLVVPTGTLTGAKDVRQAAVPLCCTAEACDLPSVGSVDRRLEPTRSERLERTKALVAERLRPVCPDFPPVEFDALVERIATLEIKYLMRGDRAALLQFRNDRSI